MHIRELSEYLARVLALVVALALACSLSALVFDMPSGLRHSLVVLITGVPSKVYEAAVERAKGDDFCSVGDGCRSFRVWDARPVGLEADSVNEPDETWCIEIHYYRYTDVKDARLVGQYAAVYRATFSSGEVTGINGRSVSPVVNYWMDRCMNSTVFP